MRHTTRIILKNYCNEAVFEDFTQKIPHKMSPFESSRDNSKGLISKDLDYADRRESSCAASR